MDQSDKKEHVSKDDDASIAHITALVKTGEISAISVDTSIFDTNKQRLDKGLFSKLRQFGRGNIDLIFPDVVWSEISLHLLESVANNRKKYGRDIVDLCEFVGGDFSEVSALRERLERLPEASVMRDLQLEHFLKEAQAEILVAGKYVTIDEIMALYFDKKPPFQISGPKRKEFPDAVALTTLERWANENDKKVMLVSKDNDWKDFCASSEHLFFISDLTTALAIFNDANDGYRAIFEYLYLELINPRSELLLVIENRLKDYDWYQKAHVEAHSQFSFDDDGAELIEVSALRFDDGLDGISLIDEGKNEISVSLRLTADLAFSVDFRFDKRDSIDRDYVSMGTTSIDDSAEVDVEVILNISLTGKDIQEMEIDITPASFNLNLGEVEPSWMKNAGYED